MSIGTAILVVAGLGALGGIARGLIGAGFQKWHLVGNLWSPGSIGDVMVGAIAATVIWALYGPYSTQDVNSCVTYGLTFAQAASSVLVGISGAQILKLMSEKQADSLSTKALIASNQRWQDAIAKLKEESRK